MEFYGKSDKDINIKFRLIDENRDDVNAIDVFQRNVRLGKEWKKFTIDFTELKYKQPKSDEGNRMMREGDKILSLDLVREVNFFFGPKQTPPIDGKPVLSGSFWIDEIKFY